MAELPRILFGHERGNLRSTRLALIESEERFLASYSGVGLVCAVNVESGFSSEQVFIIEKMGEKVVLSFRCNLARVKETV